MKMKEKEEKLKALINELLKHKKEIDDSSRAVYNILGIKEGVKDKENIRKIFLPCIQARAGPKLTTEKVKQIIREFNSFMDIKKIEQEKDLDKKFDYIFENLCNIKYIGSKITAVFMRDMIYTNKIFEELKYHLYLPIDVHIKRILTEKTDIFAEDEVPEPSESFKTKRNTLFQETVKKAHEPRVEFDYLWWVGYHFCSSRLECPFCWIKNFCKNKNFAGSSLEI